MYCAQMHSDKCTYIHVCTCIYVCVHVHVHVYMYTCACVHMYMQDPPAATLNVFSPPTGILGLPPTVILGLPPTVILGLPPTVILGPPPTVILGLPPTVILGLPPAAILGLPLSHREQARDAKQKTADEQSQKGSHPSGGMRGTKRIQYEMQHQGKKKKKRSYPCI